MTKHKIFTMSVAKVHSHYITKEKKILLAKGDKA